MYKGGRVIMRNHEKIIRKAAESEGMPYPLDDETMEFSKSVMRSMDGAVKFLSGDYEKTNVKKWLEDLQRKADEA
jgi:hypothetical protein